MDIRKAHTGDIPGLITLLLQVGQVHHELRPDIFPPATLKYDEAALASLLKDESRPVFVAMDGDFVAGYCFCAHKDHRGSGVSTDRRELYIDDLCVDENRRGQGIASALYRYVTDYAQNSGCRFITLNVWCGNDNAMHFYEKMGLRPRHIMMEAPLEEAYAD
jgi:ribosomal protein S18 acetylase RimI-like enzyme